MLLSACAAVPRPQDASLLSSLRPRPRPSTSSEARLPQRDVCQDSSSEAADVLKFIRNSSGFGAGFPGAWNQKFEGTGDYVGIDTHPYGTPVCVDLDGDGWLDAFDPMHYSEVTDWVVGLNAGVNGSGGETIIQEFEGVRVESTEQELNPPASKSDFHGTAVLDIDGDGFLDVYIAVGGGRGLGHGVPTENTLYWGESSGSSGFPRFSFRGGRKAAVDAGLASVDTRGRFNYFLDFDGDGSVRLSPASHALQTGLTPLTPLRSLPTQEAGCAPGDRKARRPDGRPR